MGDLEKGSIDGNITTNTKKIEAGNGKTENNILTPEEEADLKKAIEGIVFKPQEEKDPNTEKVLFTRAGINEKGEEQDFDIPRYPLQGENDNQ